MQFGVKVHLVKYFVVKRFVEMDSFWNLSINQFSIID